MIIVDRLAKEYGGVHACKNVSLEIEPSKITSIVGPNGAGKTTLIQLLSGVIEADAGQIIFGGVDVTRRSPSERFSLGLSRTFQTARVFPGLNVLDSVLVGAYLGVLYEEQKFGLATTIRDATASMFGLRTYRARRELAHDRAMGAIDLFGDRLKPRLKDFTFSLSYANRRRVEIARALASHPKMLMLDEPTAGMNPTETEELATTLSEVKAQNPAMTVLFIEHKMNVVRRLSDRVIAMEAGEIISDGTADDVLTDPVVVEAYLGKGERHDSQIR